jgi:hypothetical protein
VQAIKSGLPLEVQQADVAAVLADHWGDHKPLFGVESKLVPVFFDGDEGVPCVLYDPSLRPTRFAAPVSANSRGLSFRHRLRVALDRVLG